MSTPSLGGALYFLLFIENFSRFTSIYFVHNKSIVLSHFQEYKTLVENQFNNHTVIILHFDDGESLRQKISRVFASNTTFNVNLQLLTIVLKMALPNVKIGRSLNVEFLLNLSPTPSTLRLTLPAVEFAYNKSIYATTDFSLFHATSGYHPTMFSPSLQHQRSLVQIIESGCCIMLTRKST